MYTMYKAVCIVAILNIMDKWIGLTRYGAGLRPRPYAHYALLRSPMRVAHTARDFYRMDYR